MRGEEQLCNRSLEDRKENEKGRPKGQRSSLSPSINILSVGEKWISMTKIERGLSLAICSTRHMHL